MCTSRLVVVYIQTFELGGIFIPHSSHFPSGSLAGREREGGREGERKGDRERGREGGREEGRQRERERGREGRKEGYSERKK